jgi:hypothetical protein
MATYEGKLTDLMDMGYPREQARRALDISDGDLEQAIGFLLMGDESQRGFDVGSLMEDSFRGSLLSASGLSGRSSPSALIGGTVAGGLVDEDAVREIMLMGYSKQLATEALNISGGDIDQAVSFLLMGESKSGFLITERPRSDSEDADVALAAALQREELENMQSSQPSTHVAPPQRSATFSNPANNPRMVATNGSVESFPSSIPATHFCSCVFASQFLRGGTVNSAFLDSALRAGVDMMQREQDSGQYNVANNDWSVGHILKYCGKQYLGITAVYDERKEEPKQGVFSVHDLQHSLGIRKLLATCRNEQAGRMWHVLVLDSTDQSFCICLPPKGSANKFWYFDAKKR